jgi:hypothetical protein
MYSICSACEKGFDGTLNELMAWQVPGVKCPELADPDLCENSKCKYFFHEDIYYGCTRFILCDECLSSPEAIRAMLENFVQM